MHQTDEHWICYGYQHWFLPPKEVDTKSSSYFNRDIHNELSKVKKMEMKYVLKDPKIFKADPDYPTLGPIDLCGFIQEEYSVLFAE